jgi:hypothetical protein
MLSRLRLLRNIRPTTTVASRSLGGGHGHGDHGDHGHDDHHDHGPLMPPFARIAPPKHSVSRKRKFLNSY